MTRNDRILNILRTPHEQNKDKNDWMKVNGGSTGDGFNKWITRLQWKRIL